MDCEPKVRGFKFRQAEILFRDFFSIFQPYDQLRYKEHTDRIYFLPQQNTSHDCKIIMHLSELV